jgi:hypothetical protein
MTASEQERDESEVNQTEKLELLDELPYLLRDCERLSKSDRDEAINLIKDHFKAQEPLEITESGPCLICKKFIGYRVSYMHTRYGEEWFVQMRDLAASKGFFFHHDRKFKDGGIFIHKPPSGNRWSRDFYTILHFGGYVCLGCHKDLKLKFKPIEAKQREGERERDRLRKEDSDRADGRLMELKAMPYPEYLQTEHWKSLRKSRLKQSRYKCEICNSHSETLDVHHKTYERRGSEYNGDLMVLCRTCHSKFHDKLAGGNSCK